MAIPGTHDSPTTRHLKASFRCKNGAKTTIRKRRWNSPSLFQGPTDSPRLADDSPPTRQDSPTTRDPKAIFGYKNGTKTTIRKLRRHGPSLFQGLTDSPRLADDSPPTRHDSPTIAIPRPVFVTKMLQKPGFASGAGTALLYSRGPPTRPTGLLGYSRDPRLADDSPSQGQFSLQKSCNPCRHGATDDSPPTRRDSPPTRKKQAKSMNIKDSSDMSENTDHQKRTNYFPTLDYAPVSENKNVRF